MISSCGDLKETMFRVSVDSWEDMVPPPPPPRVENKLKKNKLG